MEDSRAYLVSVGADGKEGERWEITNKPLIVGRGKGEVDVLVPDKKVSRQHCVVVRQKNGQYTVEDEYSTNGTWVNGVRITRVALKPYDRILVGNAEFIFKADRPTAGRVRFPHFAAPASTPAKGDAKPQEPEAAPDRVGIERFLPRFIRHRS